MKTRSSVGQKCVLHEWWIDHHHHVPGLLQTSAIMVFQSSLSSVLLMSSMYSFHIKKLFRLLCFWYHKSFHSTFAFLVHQLCLYAQKIVVVFFWWFWVGIFWIRPFPFLLHDILIILLMYFMSAASSLLSRSFVSVQHSYIWRRMNHNYVGFQSVDFGVNSDISVGEDGLHLGKCIFRQCYSFLYFCVASDVWGYCEAQVFKGVYLFYSFPLAKNVTYRNVCFEMTMHSIFFAFSWSPLFLYTK